MSCDSWLYENDLYRWQMCGKCGSALRNALYLYATIDRLYSFAASFPLRFSSRLPSSMTSQHDPTNLPAATADAESSSVAGLDEDELKLVITGRKTGVHLCRIGRAR